MNFDEEFKNALSKALDDGVEAQRKKNEIRSMMSEFASILSDILSKRFALPINVATNDVVIREAPSIWNLFSAGNLPEHERPIIATFDELRLSYNDPDAGHHYSKRICKLTVNAKSGYPCKIEYGQNCVFCNNADEVKSAVLGMVQDLGAFFNEIETEIKTKAINTN